MKIILLFACLPAGMVFCFLPFSVVNAQVVTEDVHFDYYQSVSDNDFVNNFSIGTGLSQIQTNGITGGCLDTPDSIGWGNDNAVYCSRYRPNIGDTTRTSICFKYDSVSVNASSFQRAISIWLVPYADFNHYIVATVSHNKKLELLTYSWNNNPYPTLALLNNHWYRYVLTVAFIGGAGNQVYIQAEVFNLGLSGTSAPSLVNSSSGTINDNIIVADTSIQVSITGTAYGGAAYLDDFQLNGRKGFSNCLPTGLDNAEAGEEINIYPSPAYNVLYIDRGIRYDGNLHLTIYNFAGEKIIETDIFQRLAIDISMLSSGMYFLRCIEGNEIISKKFVTAKTVVD